MDNLTTLEDKLLTSFINCLDKHEPTFSNVYVEDLPEISGIPMKSLRGVLSSLIHKGIIVTMSFGEGDEGVAYLNEEYFHLIH